MTKECRISNYTSVAVNNYEYPLFASKKGLAIQLLSDAQLLGASHTVITVPINEYLSVEETELEFKYCDKSYFFLPEKINILDYKIKSYTESGIHVYLNIVLTAPGDDQDDALECLYMAENLSSTATYFAINSRDSDALMYFQSFMSFIADRYTAEAAPYGFAGSYIIGYEINSNRYYNYLGESTIENYVDAYETLFRAADIATRTVYSNAKLYVSVSNNFTNPSINNRVTVNDRLDYTVRAVLDDLEKKMSDIPWNVAASAYASNYNIVDIWDDDNAVSGFGTPYITMANIDVLCEYLSQNEFLYENKKRNIVITEFGVNTDPADETSLAHQAAAYAYAYYKASSLDMIEAFIYYRHVDSVAENGIYFGLWSSRPDTLSSPYQKKPIYDVFKYIDTDRSSEITQGCLQVLGIEKWEDLIGDFSQTSVSKIQKFESAGTVSGDVVKGARKYILFDFADNSLHGFMPTDNAGQITSTDASGLLNKDGSVRKATSLLANLVCDGAGGYMGIGRYFPSRLNLENMAYASVTIKVEAPVSSQNVKTMLRLYTDTPDETGKTVVYEGTASVSNGSWTTVYFDISELTEKNTFFDGMKIWISDEFGSEENNYSFWITDVSMYQKGTGVFGKVLLISVGIVCAVLAALSLLLTVRNINLKKADVKRHSDAEKRRREQTENNGTVQINFDELTKRRSNRDVKTISQQQALKNRIEMVKRTQNNSEQSQSKKQ